MKNELNRGVSTTSRVPHQTDKLPKMDPLRQFPRLMRHSRRVRNVTILFSISHCLYSPSYICIYLLIYSPLILLPSSSFSSSSPNPFAFLSPSTSSLQRVFITLVKSRDPCASFYRHSTSNSVQYHVIRPSQWSHDTLLAPLPFTFTLARILGVHPFPLTLARTLKVHPFSFTLARTLKVHPFSFTLGRTLKVHLSSSS